MLLIYKFFDYSHSPPKRSPCSTHAQNVFRSLLLKLEVCTKPTHTPPDDAISVMCTLVETESTIPATFHTCADVCCSLKCGGHVDKSVWSQQIGDNDEIYVSWTSHGNSTFNICESPLRSMWLKFHHQRVYAYNLCGLHTTNSVLNAMKS